MVYGHTPFQKLVRQYAKLMAIINPDYEIKFPDIQDKKLMDVMKVCSSVVSKIWRKKTYCQWKLLPIAMIEYSFL